MSLLANCPGRGRAGGADSAPGSAYTTTPPLSVRFGWMQPSRVMKAAVTVFKDRPMSAHKRTVDSVGRTTCVVIGRLPDADVNLRAHRAISVAAR